MADTAPTPRPWPENAWPTPEQIADWLEVCTRDERVRWASAALQAGEDQAHCLLSQHHHQHG